MDSRLILAWLYAGLGGLLAPVVVVAAWLHPRLRRHWRERLGFPTLEVEPGALWFHAASLGETRIVAALVGPLRAASPGVAVLRSCTSESARELRGAGDQAICAPLDSLPLVLFWLDRVRPRALILVEAELWPALLLGCRIRAIPVFRLAPRDGPGMARLGSIPGLSAFLLSKITPIRAEADLKALANRPPPPLRWTGAAFVAACTHEGEEESVLKAWAALEKRPLLILAPRAPARFAAVAALLAKRSGTLGFHFVRRSAGESEVGQDIDVVLLDSIGELAGLYEQARAVFIGGTLRPGVGGHSPAEAAGAGCPLVRGPDISGNLEAWSGVDAEVVGSEAELVGAIARALAKPRIPPPAAPSIEPVVNRLVEASRLPIPRERSLRPWLWPFALGWSVLARLRPARLTKAAIPVISVGALTAGGSGKTPVTAWLAERLPGSVVVSRGYGRSRGNDVRLGGEARALGDELVLLQRRGISVVSAPDRLAGIAAAARRGDRLALLDDGFQHRSVARDLEIVVIDARWPEGGGPIPVGTRRVPRSWLRRADIIWTNHGSPPEWVRKNAGANTIFVEARYRPMGWLRRGKRIPLDAIAPRAGIALAGIARPEGFFRLLHSLNLDIHRTIVFGDHHWFSWTDLQSIEAWQDEYLILTTEKDAARLPADANVHALVIDVEITSGEAELLARLAPFGLRA